MKALFLDRDGVINVENVNGYILSSAAFRFLDGVPQAIAILNHYFDLTLVVTNQRCIGKGLLTHTELDSIHHYMLSRLEPAGARIDKIYYAPALESDHVDRKPNTGMGIQAQKDFPGIDFSRSVMVGNNLSDMQFGKKLGMATYFLSTTSAYLPETHAQWCDGHFRSLEELALFFRDNHEKNSK